MESPGCPVLPTCRFTRLRGLKCAKPRKGKVAEFEIVDVLESSGYSNVHLAESATQPGWDISAVDRGGVEVFWQVKTGGIERAGEIQALMLDDPELHFAVTSEIYSRIADNSPELLGQMLDIGTDFELVAGISDGMDTLVSNLGIDVPDGVTDILPYSAAIMAGVRLEVWPESHWPGFALRQANVLQSYTA